MKTLDEVALEVAALDFPDFHPTRHEDWIVAFSRVLVERLTRDAEPIHQWRSLRNGVWHDAPKEEAYERVDDQFEARTVFLHPPIPQPTIDKSMLKRLVTQVFGEGYEITPRDSWQPIETAPKDLPGFLATNAEEFDSIEWLVDDYGDKNFYNKNSANLTGKANWTHWMPLPSAPNSLTRSLRPTNGPKDISDIGFDREEQTPNIPEGYVLVPKEESK